MGARRLSRVEDSWPKTGRGGKSASGTKRQSRVRKRQRLQGRDKPAEDPQTSGVVLLAWEPGQARERFL